MSEVEKMYRNSGIEKYKKTMLDIETGKNVLTLDSFYPEFTAEKQIAIIKWLLKSYDIGFSQLGQRIDTSLGGVNCISGLGQGILLKKV